MSLALCPIVTLCLVMLTGCASTPRYSDEPACVTPQALVGKWKIGTVNNGSLLTLQSGGTFEMESWQCWGGGVTQGAWTLENGYLLSLRKFDTRRKRELLVVSHENSHFLKITEWDHTHDWKKYGPHAAFGAFKELSTIGPVGKGNEKGFKKGISP